MADDSGRLSFFDCDVGVGHTAFSYPSTTAPSRLLGMMDLYGIQDALVYDRGAHESGRFDRFDFVLGFCGGSPRLHPSVPIVPPATGEQPPPDELVGLLVERGVKAVRACPNAHGFSFDVFSMGALLEVLQAHRIPVIHSSMRVQDHPWKHAPAWENVREVALAFPQLPIIVAYTGMLQGRKLLPVLETCPNVLADLTCSAFQFVEYVVERFGSRRLVLASHFPAEDPGLYTALLSYSGVSAEARRDVAGGNVRRLLEAVE
jgi:predicted TIM-barrel fold metal-dependent hydrolase